MRKLTKDEKKEIIRELRAEGWNGSFDEEYLQELASRILDKQMGIE